jgi:hypothetical protein
MSHRTIDYGQIWRWFNQIMTQAECREFTNMLRNLLVTELNPVFDDYLVPGLALAKGSSAPDLAELRNGLFLNAFAGAGITTEEGFFEIHILHGIRAGTTPTFHVHWTHNNATPTGDVKWFIDYSIAKGYSASTYAAPTTVSTVQTAAAQYTHHITDDDDMPISTTELEPDAVLLGRIYRDPTDPEDTFGDDAFLIDVDMHYQRDKVGTAERNRPFHGY